MENNIIKNRKRKPSRILIVLLVLLPILTIYLLKDDIISVLDISLDTKSDIQQEENENENENIENEDESIGKEHTEMADFVLDKFAKSNDLVRKANLRDIKNALVLYSNANNGNYPLSIEGTRLFDQDSEVSKELLNFTNKENLKDPKDPEYYYTYQSSDGINFKLTARLENIKDSDCEIIGDMCIYKITN